MSSLTPRQRARFEIEAQQQVRFTDEAKAALAQSPFAVTSLKDEDLSRHTMLGVGGPADAYIVVDDMSTLKDVIEFAGARNVPLMIIGRTSRMIVRDGGVRGIVMRLGAGFASIEESHDDGTFSYLKVGAAAACSALTHVASERGFEGIECFFGADGTVGGRFAARPNECASCIEEIGVVDRAGREMTYRRKALVVGDAVRFNRSSIITSLTLRVRRKAAGERPAQAVCGGFASGEVVVGRLGGIFGDVGNEPAASVIADAGLAGVRVGRVRLGSEDATMLINEGGAGARDALVLIGLVKDRVKQLRGVALDLKVGIVGED